MEKYALTKETLVWRGRLLHRIKALKDFSNIKKGDLGGFVEGEANLSQDRCCWIHDNAKAYDYSHVCDFAHLYDTSQLFDRAIMSDSSQAANNAEICGDAWISGGHVRGNSQISGCQEVTEGYIGEPKTTPQGVAEPMAEPTISEEALALRKETKLFGKETYSIKQIFN
jgi:hypothetical protein